MPLAQLAGILSDEDKKLMKDQDGGLQTFLRNHNPIFHVSFPTPNTTPRKERDDDDDDEKISFREIL